MMESGMMANILTAIRIICGLLLLHFPAFSGEYYILYLLGGFSDAIDGTIARKFGKATEFGAKFDTAADLIFAGAVIIRLICNLTIPAVFLIWAVVIALIKIAGLCTGFLKHHKLVAVHSVLNKLTGGMVFILPLFIGMDIAGPFKAAAVAFVGAVATVAAVRENVLIVRGEIIK